MAGIISHLHYQDRFSFQVRDGVSSSHVAVIIGHFTSRGLEPAEPELVALVLDPGRVVDLRSDERDVGTSKQWIKIHL